MSSPDPQRIRRAIADVEAVYADLPAIERQCVSRTTCCRFRLTGRTPMLTAGEALVAARGVRASGRTTLPPPTRDADRTDGRCPLLGADDRCTIYADRPFGCRTHFCEAAGGITPRRDVQPLIHRLEAIAETIAPHGAPRPLPDAVADALQSPFFRRRAGHRRPD